MSDSARHLASLMMTHAFHRVSQGHVKNKLNFVKHTVSGTWRNTSRTEMVATGVGLAVTGGVLIAGAVLTAGIAPAVLAGIAAGTWGVKKLINSISFEVNRMNRNWLANYSKAYSFQAKTYGDTLTMEARDALRRAIDHYNITRKIIQEELKPLNGVEFNTCNDAIKLAQATSRFIHHSDKTRNYLLPCLDLLILLLLQYKEMSNSWNLNSKILEASLLAWFEYHETVLIGHCNYKTSELCYGAASRDMPTKPRNPHSGCPMVSPLTTGRVGSVVNLGDDTVDLMQLINVLSEGSVQHVERVLRRNGSEMAATYNFHSLMRELTINPSAAAGADARLRCLINDCFELADKPKVFSRITRKLSHAVSRRTKGEIAKEVFAEVVDLGSVGTPFIPDLPIAKVLGAMLNGGTLIRGGITATTKLSDILVGVAISKSNEEPAIRSGLLEFTTRQEASTNELKAAGVKVQDLITKTATHFHNAYNACQELEKAAGAKITDCRQAWSFCKVMAEVVHEMDKMEKYLMSTLSLVVYLTNQTILWAEEEPALWKSMESSLAEWVADDMNHLACREADCHCYGPKVTRIVRGGTFTNRLHGRYDYISDPLQPHKKVA